MVWLQQHPHLPSLLL